MAVTIREMKRRFIRAEQNLDSDIEVIVKILEHQIIDLNREDQLFEKSINIYNKSIGLYAHTYEPEIGQSLAGYPKIKDHPYNLHDYGDFSKSFRLEKGNGKLKIFNDDPKLSLIEQNTGKGLIGLTIDNTEKLNFKMIRPMLVDFVRRHIKGN